METRKEVSYDVLKKYGSRWAVLTAMKMDFEKRGVKFPVNVESELKTSRIQITSGCYSTCEVDCVLNTIEGQIISCGADLGEKQMDPWIDLLARSMKGELDYDTIVNIPALQPVKSDCGFLKCSC